MPISHPYANLSVMNESDKNYNGLLHLLTRMKQERLVVFAGFSKPFTVKKPFIWHMKHFYDICTPKEIIIALPSHRLHIKYA